jgi:hypothetical protein
VLWVRSIPQTRHHKSSHSSGKRFIIGAAGGSGDVDIDRFGFGWDRLQAIHNSLNMSGHRRDLNGAEFSLVVDYSTNPSLFLIRLSPSGIAPI